MKLRKTLSGSNHRIEALGSHGWVSLDQVRSLSKIGKLNKVEGTLANDMLAVLQLGPAGWAELQQQVNKLPAGEDALTKPLLPIEPRSFRDFMLFESHVIDSSRGYIRRFNPGTLKITSAYEKITGKPFPKFRPSALWYKQPIYYFGNHLNFQPSEAPILWPSYTQALDYELELGIILAKPLFNASLDQAEKAIGGFVVFNDVSARDVQLEEMQSGFGPQKAKHFVNTMSDVLITPDEIESDLTQLTGSVNINDQCVAKCSMQDMKYSIPEILSFASKGEQLHPGELFGTGTLPGGSGMENGHWLKPGDRLTLDISGIGQVSNTISQKK